MLKHVSHPDLLGNDISAIDMLNLTGSDANQTNVDLNNDL